MHGKYERPPQKNGISTMNEICLNLHHGKDGSPVRDVVPSQRDSRPNRPGEEEGRLAAVAKAMAAKGDASLSGMSLPDASLPKRKWLGHAVPNWVEHGIFFITINCCRRGGDDLIRGDTHRVLRESALHYHNLRWWIHLWLIMPDHVHALLSFPQSENMTKVLADWKRFVARKTEVEWQKGFFDHRLRHDESVEEKAHYIRMNPVRDCLVRNPEEWPHVLAFDGRDGSPNRPGEEGRLGEASLP